VAGAQMTPMESVTHVAIAVRSIDETLTLFRDILGAVLLRDEQNEELGVHFVQLALAGLEFELMAPLRADSLLQRQLDAHGPGFHHVTLSIDDRRIALMEPGHKVLVCARPNDRFVRLMDNLIHDENESIRDPRNTSPEEPIPPPEGLLRSRRQEEILALIVANPETEYSLSGLGRRLGIPYSSVHREIERAERFGIVKTRRFESLRLARANVDSPYYAGLAALLRR
jgi:catechol 2,3-dioxygenase-like lactoylglutathione lyase family enzyme